MKTLIEHHDPVYLAISLVERIVATERPNQTSEVRIESADIADLEDTMRGCEDRDRHHQGGRNENGKAWPNRNRYGKNRKRCFREVTNQNATEEMIRMQKRKSKSTCSTTTAEREGACGGKERRGEERTEKDRLGKEEQEYKKRIDKLTKGNAQKNMR